jgi:hypothetical protein
VVADEESTYEVPAVVTQRLAAAEGKTRPAEQDRGSSSPASALTAAMVRAAEMPAANPILVHCGNGASRTGTLLALDICLRQLELFGCCDPCAVLHALREDRMAMAPHPAQYALVHEACLAAARSRAQVALIVSEKAQLPVDGLAPGLEVQIEDTELLDAIEHLQPTDEYNLAETRARHAIFVARHCARAHLREVWYHGIMTREEAAERLQRYVKHHDKPQGTFLIRASPKNPTVFAVSQYVNGEVRHSGVEYADGAFRTGKGKTFPTLAAVVAAGRLNKANLHAELTHVSEDDPRVCVVTAILDIHTCILPPFPPPLFLQAMPNEAAAAQRSLGAVSLTAEDLMHLSMPAHHSTEASSRVSELGLRRAGWVSKQGAGRGGGGNWALNNSHGGVFARRNWRKRWFVLQDTMIKYYSKRSTGVEQATGYINLSSDASVTLTSAHAFTLDTARRTYNLSCDDASEAVAWVDVISKAIASTSAAAKERDRRATLHVGTIRRQRARQQATPTTPRTQSAFLERTATSDEDGAGSSDDDTTAAHEERGGGGLTLRDSGGASWAAVLPQAGASDFASFDVTVGREVDDDAAVRRAPRTQAARPGRDSIRSVASTARPPSATAGPVASAGARQLPKRSASVMGRPVARPQSKKEGRRRASEEAPSIPFNAP